MEYTFYLYPIPAHQNKLDTLSFELKVIVNIFSPLFSRNAFSDVQFLELLEYSPRLVCLQGQRFIPSSAPIPDPTYSSLVAQQLNLSIKTGVFAGQTISVTTFYCLEWDYTNT